MRVIDTVPDWEGEDGEHLLYVSGTIRRLYFYDLTNLTWQYLEWNQASGGAFYGDRILDSAGTTGIFTEYSASEQTLRFYIDGTYVMAINDTGISIGSDFPLAFNGLNGNTYSKYNTSSGYFEIYVGGNLRVQM